MSMLVLHVHLFKVLLFSDKVLIEELGVCKTLQS